MEQRNSHVLDGQPLKDPNASWRRTNTLFNMALGSMNQWWKRTHQNEDTQQNNKKNKKQKNKYSKIPFYCLEPLNKLQHLDLRPMFLRGLILTKRIDRNRKMKKKKCVKKQKKKKKKLLLFVFHYFIHCIVSTKNEVQFRYCPLLSPVCCELCLWPRYDGKCCKYIPLDINNIPPISNFNTFSLRVGRIRGY